MTQILCCPKLLSVFSSCFTSATNIDGRRGQRQTSKNTTYPSSNNKNASDRWTNEAVCGSGAGNGTRRWTWESRINTGPPCIMINRCHTFAFNVSAPASRPPVEQRCCSSRMRPPRGGPAGNINEYWRIDLLSFVCRTKRCPHKWK